MRVYTYRGWCIWRGAYQGTADDRSDRWYVCHYADRDIDRRGPGYATLAAARAAIKEEEEDRLIGA
jgi:hypothetical protein